MKKNPILDFLFNYLNDLNISCLITDGKGITMSDLDNGLRSSILKLSAASPSYVLKEIEENAIYHIIDYYECNYTFFRFPDTKEFLFAGPYLLQPLAEAEIQPLMNRLKIPQELFGQLCDYYYSIPCITGQSFQLLFLHAYNSLFESRLTDIIHVDLKNMETREQYLDQHQFLVSEDPILSMRLLEKRYQIEDELLDAVAHGNTVKALSFAESMQKIRFLPRTNNEERDAKNLTITFNTLLRRAVYKSGVPPFYIDAISCNFVRLIEQCQSIKKINDIVPYMIKSYCNLASKHNTTSYSEPVRQILVTIDASLTADLSLKRFARDLFLNTSYLSALFKKEVGMTLTDYVNKSRIEYAKKLLKSTTLSIQNIAAQSGFSDIHYFNRLFRRETGHSPKEWRNR